MPLTVNQRVQAGADFLDINVPNWLIYIKEPVDVASVTLCPWGQIYGNFSTGQGVWIDIDANDYGFNGKGAGVQNDYQEDCKHLSDAWDTLIRRRRSVPPSTISALNDEAGEGIAPTVPTLNDVIAALTEIRDDQYIHNLGDLRVYPTDPDKGDSLIYITFESIYESLTKENN